MSKYITEIQRYKIEFLLGQKVPVKEIAKEIGKHYTTIYREIKRGRVTQIKNEYQEKKVYCADYAQMLQEKAGHNKGRAIKLGHDYQTAEKIERLIKEEKYSPYAVSMILRYNKELTYLCTNTIYNYIDKGYVNVSNTDLPHGKEPRKEKQEVRRPSLRNIGASMIEERPKEASQRKQAGHWEMDTVYGGKNKSKTCLLVFTERKTREEIIIQMPDRTAKSTVAAINKMEMEIGADKFRERFLTITADNGVEFSDYKSIEKSCVDSKPRTKIYFCHPFCSSERASNENANRLIRRHIKKGEDIGQYTPEQIAYIEKWVNNYPRRIFGGLSSNQIRAACSNV